MRITFLGDISLNNRLEHKSDLFEEFDFLKDEDFVIGNLECLVRGEMGINPYKIPSLSTSEDSFGSLRNLNLTHVSLANNHVYDNLESGFEKTTSKLNELGIKYFGAEVHKKETNFICLKKKDTKVGVLAYLDLNTNPNPPRNTKINVSALTIPKVKKDVAKWKNECDFLILYLHWGGRSENRCLPDYSQNLLISEIKSLDVDFVIGHHSHVVHPIAMHNELPVFYSLGNFCFDDIKFKDQVIRLKNVNREGAIISLEFESNNFTTYKVKRFAWDNNFKYNFCVKDKKVQKLMFQLVIFLHPKLLDLPYFIQNIIVRPIKFLFKDNFFRQLSKINYKKIKQLLK